jgi:ubiquinone/menaquinone biosynthesis C-methylase UbiE
MNKKRGKIKINLANCECYDNEDLSVFAFLNELDKERKYKMLEVGSGLCRFVDKVNKQYSNIDITCFEINENLAKIARSKGFQVINENILKNSLLSEEYDIVHCSHVIEHFKYPEIVFVIDELLRVIKKDGFCIIRTPLLWEEFYDDIDHVRIYPPRAIINYFNHQQQQKQGNNKVQIMSIWYRTSPKRYQPITTSSLMYAFPFIRYFWNRYLLPKINNGFKCFWNRYRFPATKPNGYVMILKKTI